MKPEEATSKRCLICGQRPAYIDRRHGDLYCREHAAQALLTSRTVLLIPIEAALGPED